MPTCTLSGSRGRRGVPTDSDDPVTREVALMRCPFVKLTISCVCLLLPLSPARPARAEPLKIGDGSGWTFVNSRWADGEAGITGARTGDGDGLQGYCLAFARTKAFSDVEATFTVQLKSGHADIGL